MRGLPGFQREDRLPAFEPFNPSSQAKDYKRRGADTLDGISGIQENLSAVDQELVEGAAAEHPDIRVACLPAFVESGGVSRTEYLRRALERECVVDANPVTVDQLKRIAALAEDLDDPNVMSGAWS